ncbi:MAG TPA: hypothetical protein PKE16_12310 [Hyphomicrobium sp.]|nr:hypothetical protein [Hyphomicrobium sp.]
MSPRTEPWTFAVTVPAQPVVGPLEPSREVISPKGENEFVHGASVVAMPNGLMAFWYRAKYEGANNAELVSSHFDGKQWAPTHIVTTSAEVSRDFAFRVKSLANSLPPLGQ